MKLNATALVATVVVFALGTSIFLASTTSSKRGVRWVRQCDVSLKFPHGSLTARRTLSERGELSYHDDSANWYSDKHNNDLQLSISWSGGSETGPGLGRVNFYIQGDTMLPSNGRFSFKRSNDVARDKPLPVRLELSDNRVVASGGVGLDELLAYIGDAGTLDWSYEGQKVRKSGGVDVIAVREAVSARRVAGERLAKMTADFANSCPRVPDQSPLIIY